LDYIGFNGSATSFNLLADLRFKDADGSHYVGFQAPSSVGTNLVWTLPASDGAANRVLKTDGSGNLSFAEITNAYVASNAAIAGTKISPDFGSQNIVTTGTAATGALGVTGNLTISGTVDGVDIASRDTLFGGLTSSSGVLTDGVSATTQTSSDNTTKVATTAYVTTAVNNLINGAPAALDTLNELAAAMNDDAAFSTTVTNSLATKLALAGGQMTGNITFSGSQTVDGRDLSVDGAKLDGGIMLADGDKGDITVSSSGATFTIDSGVVTTAKIADDAVTAAKIADVTITATQLANFAVGNAQLAENAVTHNKILNGTILNEDINASAAIAGTKISPDFGSQNVSMGEQLTISATTPNILFTDTNNNPDYRLKVDSGALTIEDAADNSDKFVINSDGHIDIDGNVDFGAGIDVTGNITVTGTVDGRDLATDGSKLDGIATGATNVSNTNQLTNGAGFLTSVATSNIADDAVTQAKIANDAVGTDQIITAAITSATIADGAIVNADVNASAAIAGSKISPDFGSQNVVTTGTLGSDDITITGTKPKLVLNDSNNENDFHIQNDDGTFAIKDIDSDTGRLTIASNGQTSISGNCDFGAGIDVTGDITATGDLTITSATPIINLTDTNNDSDYQIKNGNGDFNIKDVTNNANRISINSSGTVTIAQHMDVGAGLDVTGNITVTGTVDGRDLATDGSKLDGGIMLADGDKGDITVSSSGATFTIDNDAVTSAKILDGTIVSSNIATGGIGSSNLANNSVTTLSMGDATVTTAKIVDSAVTSAKIADGAIVNADINASAAIAGSKISPDFGSQNIATTGSISVFNSTITGSISISNSSPTIFLTDNNDTPDYGIRNDNGVFKIIDFTNSADRLQIQTDGVVDITTGILGIKNTGSQSVLRLYCESSNAHYAAVQAPAHSVFSGNVTLTLPAAAGNQSLVGTTETQTLTNKTLTSAVLNTGVSGSAILDEDNMASNSATQLATQQSIKAYVDANAGGGGGSPGGSNTQVQFNNSGSFGGSSNLTFDGTNLTVGGTITATSAASSANGIRKITASTSAPSGGSDGDVWIKYTA